MGIVDYNPNAINLETEITGPSGPAAPDTNAPSILGAAFRQENPMVSAYINMTKEPFVFDPEWNAKEAFKGSDLFQANPDAYVGVQSQAEFEWTEAKVAQEIRDKRALGNAGLLGFMANMAAGLLSPTIVLPGGQIRGATTVGKAVKNVGAMGFVSVGLDEAVLMATQETRTTQEAAMNIASGTVLAGLLGGGVKYLLPSEKLAFESGMVNEHVGSTVQRDYPETDLKTGKAAGAQINRYEITDVNEVAKGASFLKLNQLNPVTRTLTQSTSNTAQYIQRQLGTGGLRFEGNKIFKAASSGGDVETLSKQWEAKYFAATKAVEQIYKENSHSRIPGIRFIGFTAFSEDVGKALVRGGKADNPAVEKAAEIYRQQVYLPAFREAKSLGMPGFVNLDEKDAMSYLTRDVSSIKANNDYEGFTGVLEEHFNELFTKKLTDGVNKLNAADKAVDVFENDMKLAPDEVKKMQGELTQQMEDMIGSDPKTSAVDAELKELQLQVKTLKGKAKVAARHELKAFRLANADTLKEIARVARPIKTRLRNFNYTREGMLNQQRKLLETIETIEDQQIATMTRAVHKLDKFAAEMSTMSEKAYKKGLKQLEANFIKALKASHRGQQRLDKLNAKGDTTAGKRLIEAQNARKLKVEEAFNTFSKLGNASKPDVAKVLKAMKRDVEKNVLRINTARSERIARIQKKLPHLTPEARAKIVKEKRTKLAIRRDDFESRFIEGGGVRTDDGININNYAKRMAQELAPRLLKENSRAPAIGLLGERGSELARTLNIDETRVWSNGKSYENFLNRDVDRMSRTYIRSIGADIELYRKFGTVNPLKDEAEFGRKLGQDFIDARQAVMDDANLSAAEKEKAFTKIAKDKHRIMTDLTVQISRIRHTRGIPEDPTHIGFRAGRTVLDVNVLRQMGTVVPTSIGDVARPVMKFGLLDAFKDGFIPMVTNLKKLKMAKEEAQLAGTALDLVTHGRAAAMFDQMEDIEYGSKLEGMINQVSNKMGVVALFDYWNVANKSVSASIAMSKMSRAIQQVALGKATQEQREFLAYANLNESDIHEIHKLTQATGTMHRGTMFPNTKDWASGTDEFEIFRGQSAQRTYRAALAKLIDDTVITPGLERPNVVDNNIMNKLLFQFKSFSFSSTVKTTQVMGQDLRGGRKMQLAVGTTFSLALGALSYYVWGISRGGASMERMLNATPAEWADEAVARSGLLGILGEVQRIGSEVPGLQKLVTAGQVPISRNNFGTPVSDLLGPTAGLLGELDTIVRTIDEPDAQTAKAARRIVPFNNVFYLSRIFSEIAG